MSAVDGWTSELQPLLHCKVLPALPDVNALRSATHDALHQQDEGDASAVFASQQLYDAVLRCVKAEPGIPKSCHTPAALLIASVAMEEYVRAHSTKAKLASATQARRARAAEEAAAADADANGHGDADGEAALLAFLRSSTPEQIAERLLGVLQEPPASRTPLANLARKHDPETLAEILRQTRLAHTTGDTERADGRGKRTLGGVFFQQAKRFKACIAREAARAALPELPPLRPYQRDVVGMVCASWGLGLTTELLTGGGGQGREREREAAKEERARFRGLGGGWSRNWLVCAPTNSGKTRMFVEVTRAVVASKPPGRGALVVVLVPNVLLTPQHATYFERAGLPRTAVSAHSSDNPLAPGDWQRSLAAAGAGRSAVLVCTGQVFLNLLNQRAASLEQLDLLVLDEAHHCKEDHPYAKVVASYVAGAASSPRLLAVTASPASERDLVTLSVRMSDLLRRLDAQLHMLDEGDPHVAAAVPEPRQVECPVAVRPVDRKLMLALQGFAIDAAMQLAESIAGARASGLDARADKLRLEQELDAAVNATRAAPSAPVQSLVTALDPLGQWLARGLKFACDYDCPHLELACRLVDVLRKSIELVEDAGFEGALPFLARKAAVLCREEAEVIRRAGGGAAVAMPSLPAGPSATPFRGLMFSAAIQAAASRAAAGGTAAAASGEEPWLFEQLRSATAQLPSAHAVAAERAAAAAAELPSPGNTCPDVSLRVSELLRELLVDGGDMRFLGAPESARLARDCFASGLLQKDCTFPKFWALLEYLQGYRERETFHGIIFVKTRQAVFHVADMMRRTEQLSFVEVFELIGHNSSAGKRSTLAPERDRHGRGMSDAQQQDVLRLFKASGRKVLVATSAAEEGLDVPSCEFVVRYNAAATGIQLLQSRGRARQKVAEFFAILQEGTLDTQLHAKSRQEEANMRAYGRLHAETAARKRA